MNYIRKHYKAAFLIGLSLVSLMVFFAWQRKVTLSETLFDRLKDDPRGGAVEDNDFYSSQLTEKESQVYQFLKEKVENFQGGVLTLPEKVDGKEYQRIITTLEYEGYNYFYGFVDIPMTEDGTYVQHEEKDLNKITKDHISQVVLFLSCAEGIELSGEFAEDGKLSNLNEISRGLSVNKEDKLAEIQKTQAETDEILKKIIDDMPKDYGEKSTVNYFLKWMDENMELKRDVSSTAKKLENIGDMLDQVYPYNHLTALKEEKATVLGYAKILSELCRRAGIESHIVIGNWNGTWSEDEKYVLCAVTMNDQTIYIDASGEKNRSLAGTRYLTEKEALNRMSFMKYFKYD